MAEDAIDKIAEDGKVQVRGECCTTHLPLVGAHGFSPALFTEVAQNYIVPHRPGAIDTNVAKHLAGNDFSMKDTCRHQKSYLELCPM